MNLIDTIKNLMEELKYLEEEEMPQSLKPYKDLELILLDQMITSKDLQDRNRQRHISMLSKHTPVSLDEAIRLLNIKANDFLTIGQVRYLCDLIYEANIKEAQK